jgi:hypothetical protein
MALKQRDTDFPFERPDSRCHVGLNGMKFGSRPIHAAVTGHCLEHLEVGDIHAVYLDEIDKAWIRSSQARTALRRRSIVILHQSRVAHRRADHDECFWQGINPSSGP